jgi:hypothetical protein
MSNQQTELYNEMVEEFKNENPEHLYSDYCQCRECQDAREMKESDDYDLKTCHTV